MSGSSIELRLLVGNSLDQMDRRLSDLDGVTLHLKERAHSLGILLDPLMSLEAQAASVMQSALLQLQLVTQLHPVWTRITLLLLSMF